MLNETSLTEPSFTTTWRPPSPSTRARASTSSERLRLCVMRRALLCELGAPAVKLRKRRTIWAGVAPSAASRSDSEMVLAVADGPKQPKQARPTPGHTAPHPALVTGPRHGVAPGHEDADVGGGLALLAYRVARDPGRPAGQVGGQDLEELMGVHRATPHLEVHRHVSRDRCRSAERVDVTRVGVDGAHVLAYGGVVAQALDAARGGAGPDGHQERDEPRTILALSASWLVVTEPSTRETS